MRVIVCGGRDWLDETRTFEELDRIHERTPITYLIEGGQRTRHPTTLEIIGGADYWALKWAIARRVAGWTVRANWTLYGRKAGPLRNKMMLTLHPDAIIAFPGGSGTANMIKRAQEQGVPVIRVCQHDTHELPGDNKDLLEPNSS